MQSLKFTQIVHSQSVRICSGMTIMTYLDRIKRMTHENSSATCIAYTHDNKINLAIHLLFIGQ